MRSAMIRQTVPTAGAATRGAAGAVVAGRAAVGTSATRTAPPGPEPGTMLISTPRSAASRRAFGDAAASRAATPLPAGAPRLLPAQARGAALSLRPPAGLPPGGGQPRAP